MKKVVISIDPSFFDSGEIGSQTGDIDEYFGNDTESTLRMVVDVFLKLLPEHQKEAVEMCVMANLTYEEAAERISLLRGITTDKKTVWRWSRAGVEKIQGWMKDSPWVGPLTNGKIPVDFLDVAVSTKPPWEETNG
jgi:hypothetical protein